MAKIELSETQLDLIVGCLETVKQDIEENVLYGLIEGVEVRQQHIDAIQSVIAVLSHQHPTNKKGE